MSTFTNLECWEWEKAASGTVTLPTYFNFTDTAPDENEEYEVLITEGLGAVDAGTKAFDSFDVTVTAGPLRGKVFPKKLGGVTQVN